MHGHKTVAPTTKWRIASFAGTAFTVELHNVVAVNCIFSINMFAIYNFYLGTVRYYDIIYFLRLLLTF